MSTPKQKKSGELINISVGPLLTENGDSRNTRYPQDDPDWL